MISTRDAEGCKWVACRMLGYSQKLLCCLAQLVSPSGEEHRCMMKMLLMMMKVTMTMTMMMLMTTMVMMASPLREIRPRGITHSDAKSPPSFGAESSTTLVS